MKFKKTVTCVAFDSSAILASKNLMRNFLQQRQSGNTKKDQAAESQKCRSPQVLFPNQSTALKVVEPELIRIYGARVIGLEKPLNAGLSGDMWIVSGTLHCRDGKGGATTLCVGGVATAYVSKSDGRVLFQIVRPNCLP